MAGCPRNRNALGAADRRCASGRLDPQAREQVAHGDHLEPGSGGCRGPLVAAAEAAPAAELGEGVLDPVEPAERHEAARPLRRGLDVERELTPGGEAGET